MEESIPLDVPVVMCLAEQNGVGLRIRLDATAQHRDGQFCETCPARAPCDTYHQQEARKT